VLNGLPIIPEIVVLNRFIAVVLKVSCSMASCKPEVSNQELGIKSPK
jgi:hypothetical protein